MLRVRPALTWCEAGANLVYDPALRFEAALACRDCGAQIYGSIVKMWLTALSILLGGVPQHVRVLHRIHVLC